MYYSGDGVTENKDNGIELLKQSDAQKNGAAIRALKLLGID